MLCQVEYEKKFSSFFFRQVRVDVEFAKNTYDSERFGAYPKLFISLPQETHGDTVSINWLPY